MKITKEIVKGKSGFNQCIIIHTDYDELLVPELPKSCVDCPAGICIDKGEICGRNKPFNAEDVITRPDTCKLVKYNSCNILQSTFKLDTDYIFTGHKIDLSIFLNHTEISILREQKLIVYIFEYGWFIEKKTYNALFQKEEK